jgi:hypothetical protein
MNAVQQLCIDPGGGHARFLFHFTVTGAFATGWLANICQMATFIADDMACCGVLLQVL